MSRGGLALLVFLANLLTARGQPDPDWLKKPYQLTLVLHVQPHPLMTPAFIDQMDQEMRNALQREFGKACNVEVIRKHPLLEEVLLQGWAALDKPQALDDKKLHFVRLAVREGQYEIEARQLDGATTLAGPLRKARTEDRLTVGRLAALTVAQDFGVVGELGEVKESIVELRLKAAGLGESAALKVQPGEVFALTQIVQGRDGKPRAVRVPDALLYVTTVQDGQCTTRLFERFQNSLAKDASTIGFRAVKLGTREGPVRLRVLDAKTREPVVGAGVTFGRSGFETAPAADAGATDHQGRLQSKRSYPNVVFVQVAIGGRPRAQTPIPLVDDQLVEVLLSGTEEAEQFVVFEHRYRQWMRKAGELTLGLDEDIRKVTDLDRANQPKAAVDKARLVESKLRQELPGLQKSLEEVKKFAKGAGRQADSYVGEAERYLAALQNQADSLNEFIQIGENPTPAQKFVKQARLLEEAAEAEQAIETYRQALQAGAPVEARLKKLEEAWRIKDERHRRAREFVEQTWNRLKAEDLEARLPEADRALTDCIAAQDFLTARRLAKLNVAHLDVLTNALSRLDPAASADHRDQAQAIARIAEGLGNLNKRIAEFLEKSAK